MRENLINALLEALPDENRNGWINHILESVGFEPLSDKELKSIA